MPVWLLPVINLVGPVLVKTVEGIFTKSSPSDPQTGPQKKEYVLNWLLTTWDLLVYLNVIPPAMQTKRDTIITTLDGLIEGWVSSLKAQGQL